MYSHPNLNFLQYTVQILIPHVMWSAQAVRDSKMDHTQRHLSALSEPKARNSAVGWHWNKQVIAEVLTSGSPGAQDRNKGQNCNYGMKIRDSRQQTIILNSMNIENSVILISGMHENYACA